MSEQSIFIDMPSTGNVLELTYHGSNFLNEPAVARRFILGLVARMEKVEKEGFPKRKAAKKARKR